MENYEFKKYKFLNAYIKVKNYKFKKRKFLKAYIKAKNYWFKKYKFLKAYIKMEKVITFGDIEIYKQTFHQHKEPTSLKNVDIDKIVVSKKVSFGKKGFKYFIGYKDVKK